MTEPKFEIAVRNKSRMEDLDVASMCSAINRQVRYHAAPIWGVDVTVEFDQRPEGYDWIVDLVNTPTITGAAGWHSIDDNGRVISEVALDTGLEASVVLSHEVLEMIGNESVAKFVINWNDGFLYAHEICDAVQANTYRIENWLVSDFVTPEWFSADRRNRGRTAFKTRNLAPFEIAPGGYMPRYTQRWEDATTGRSAIHGHARLEYIACCAEGMR